MDIPHNEHVTESNLYFGWFVGWFYGMSTLAGLFYAEVDTWVILCIYQFNNYGLQKLWFKKVSLQSF